MAFQTTAWKENAMSAQEKIKRDNSSTSHAVKKSLL
jgi:hypothetical protein